MADLEVKTETGIGDMNALAVDLSASEVQAPGEVEKSRASVLVVIGEVHTDQQRNLALQRLVEGLSSWDSEAAGCDIAEELSALAKLQPKGLADPSGETVFEHDSELLRVVVLVNPRRRVVEEKLHSLLLNGSCYRFVLYSGLTIHGSGSWLLSDGCFSFGCILEVFHRHDVVEAVAKQQNAKVDVSVATEGGDWTAASVAKLSSRLVLRLNRPKSEKNLDGLSSFSTYISSFLNVSSAADLLSSSKAVGTLSQGSPSMHIFPAGDGDSALFCVNGFNLLFDGGYLRRSCFWELVRHLHSLDAIVVSHLGPDNLFGILSFLEKKSLNKEFPELGVVFYNSSEAKHLAASNKSQGDLQLSIAEKGLEIVDHLNRIGTTVLPCVGSVRNQPIPLYHKVGHGSAELHILNPLGDSKDTKDLLSGLAKNPAERKGGVSVLDHLSVSSVLVWKVASPHSSPVRILYPGGAPQTKIFEGLDRLKNVGIFQSFSGSPEKNHGDTKGAEKATGVGGKAPHSAKSRPSAGLKTESKDVKKPVGDGKNNAEQPKETKAGKKAGEQKDAKKAAAVAAEVKNGKTSASGKKDAPAKGTPTPAKSVSKAEADAGKKKLATKERPGSTSGKKQADVAATAADESPKAVIDEASTIPSPSEEEAPIDASSVKPDDLQAVDVQGLPEPVNKLEEEEREKGIAEAEEHEGKVGEGHKDENSKDSEVGGDKKGEADTETGAKTASFDAAKEWGIPEGLPAPVNGKDPATARKASSGQNASVAGAESKKAAETKTTNATKTNGKRPMTAPDRLNTTTKDGTEKSDKTTANQSIAKGRQSLVPSHRDSIGSARVEPKKPASSKPVVPFYVDVAYIPGHGCTSHFDIDFFRRVRARNYVLSSTRPNPKVLAMLVEAKQTWEDPNAEVTVIPTYDSQPLLEWLAGNRDQLQKLNVKVTSPASKCLMQMQEIGSTCASYRLEF